MARRSSIARLPWATWSPAASTHRFSAAVFGLSAAFGDSERPGLDIVNCGWLGVLIESLLLESSLPFQQLAHENAQDEWGCFRNPRRWRHDVLQIVKTQGVPGRAE
jgi:hypothetical protein